MMNFKLITWDIERDKIWYRDFENENDVMTVAMALSTRSREPHDVITLMGCTVSKHRWDLAVWDIDKLKNRVYIPFRTKKDAIFATKKIKEYDDTLKTSLTKIY